MASGAPSVGLPKRSSFSGSATSPVFAELLTDAACRFSRTPVGLQETRSEVMVKHETAYRCTLTSGDVI